MPSINAIKRTKKPDFLGGRSKTAYKLMLPFAVLAGAGWLMSLYHSRDSMNIERYMMSYQYSGDIYDQRKSNPWDGWQPEIPDEMECSWRKCFYSVDVDDDDVGQCDTCRDSPYEMGEAPWVPTNWIPDVTMLHRMMLKGVDRNGNVWPPVLSQELCEDMGPEGGPRRDLNKKILDLVPITAQPMVSEDAKEGPTILCLMYTVEFAHANRVRAARETWAGGCDGFLAFSTANDPRIPAISIPHEGEESYKNMWQKTRSIWKFVAEHYVEDFDFFYLGGDDIYVLPQNLRRFLRTVGSPDRDHFVGRRLKGPDAVGYFNSGGAGYVLTRSTLKKLVAALDTPVCVPHKQTFMEDAMVASCLRRAWGIEIEDTRDEEQRERFHHYGPGASYSYRPAKPGTDKTWYESYSKEFGLKLGKDCCAPDSVSFHYIKKPAAIRHLHQLFYHCHSHHHSS